MVMAGVTGSTLVELFAGRVKATPDAVAFRTRSGDAWTTITYGELAGRTREVANGLISLGVEPGSCVSLLSKNRAEWILSDLAILSAGARSVPIYVTNSPRQVGHVVGHSESTVVSVEDRDQLDKVLKVRDELPLLKTIVVVTGEGAGEDPGVISYDELRTAGSTHAGANPGALDKLVSNLKDCRPTLFAGVPRVYEKFYAGVQANVAKQPTVKRALVTKAVAAGKEKVALEQSGKPIPFALAKRHALLDHLVLSKLRHELGMDACALAVTGAAPISTEVLGFVHALGVRLVEGYGLTETTAPVSVNPAGKIRIGTVGPPLPGVQVRFDSDGELLVKGYNVFSGYYKNDEATAAALTSDGFFRTGDVGQFDEAGYIKITDRKKDIIVTASGKNVPPQILEERLKSEPIISQVLVIGDRRPYLVALITR